jgi:hypothetical protein
VTHARPAGGEGRGAIGAMGQRPHRTRVRARFRRIAVRFRAPRTLTAQGGARAAVAASQLLDPFRPEQMIGVAAGAPRCGAEAPRSLLEASVTGWCKHGIRTHDRRHLKPLLYRTELTCWRQRPRPRAVHASAIHSAGAPGGTHEPAPLTRLPSRPRYGTAQPTRARPDGTRGRSRTCVLWVQSPTGMPATHGSCIGSGGRNRTCVGCVQSAAGMPATHT